MDPSIKDAGRRNDKNTANQDVQKVLNFARTYYWIKRETVKQEAIE